MRNWQKIDADAVVAQAKTLASRPRQIQIGDDLTALEGIGPTYATKLRAAGIVTFDQLATADEATLDEIIGAPAWRRVNYGDWIAQAKLAAAGDQAGLLVDGVNTLNRVDTSHLQAEAQAKTGVAGLPWWPWWPLFGLLGLGLLVLWILGGKSPERREKARPHG